VTTAHLAGVLLIVSLATAGCGREVTDPSTPPGPFEATSKPPTPHVWLHYDYLVYPDGHSDAPDPAAIQMVVDVYAAHGIVLEIDTHHAAVPTSNPFVNITPGCGALLVSDVRAQYFHPTANHEWHYALFGDNIPTNFADADGRCFPGFGGMAELNGDNFAISMAAIRIWGRPGCPSSPEMSCTSSATTSVSITGATRTPTTSRTTSAS
jgi:hypothetical protein